VLDWELSTLGHPLADFSYHFNPYWSMHIRPAKKFAAVLPAIWICRLCIGRCTVGRNNR